MNIMKTFLSALQFLTIIPIKTKLAIDDNNLPNSIIWFPVVGLILGLVLAGVNTVLSLLALEKFFIDVILIILLIILTGGLHLDGLADTFDAFSSRKDRFEILRIMRDSHIGTMGVLGLITIILLKVSLLFSLDIKVMNGALILMCLLSRYALVFSMFLFPYAREEGKAKIFIDGMNLKSFSFSALMTFLGAFIVFGVKGIVVFIILMVFVYLAGRFITGKIGGITGDTLGAVNEFSEVFVLLNIFILMTN